MPSSVPLETAPANGEQSPAPRRKGTLLIVDDEESPRQSLRVVFKDDYEILMASDGATAIELAQNHKVDVAVLDIRMAGMSGIEVLERLKYVDPALEVVMMTAFETTDTIRQALRLRACDYINKPFDISTMRAAVAGAMQRRTLESEIHNNAEKLQELLAELQSQRIEEQITNTRGEIYASIIHDINGPLTVISGFIQLMNQRLGNATRLDVEDLEFIKDRLRIITRQVTNCIEISQRYLSFLRRQSDEAPRVGINQLLNDLSHLINVHPSLQNNKFAIHPLPEDIGVKINGTDLIQILLNLTVNAFQCTPQSHHVDIEGCVITEPLDLTAFKDGSDARFLNVENFANVAPLVKLSVRDDGPVISGGNFTQNFSALFYHQRSQARDRIGVEHCATAHQAGKWRFARADAAAPRDHVHSFSPGIAADRKIAVVGCPTRCFRPGCTTPKRS